MNDFDGLFTSDFGLKPQGKSKPMAPNASSVSLNFDFGSFATPKPLTISSLTSSNSPHLPVYDKPIYDDDIFDGVPSLNTSSSKVKFDDVFAATSDGVDAATFEDLLGGFGKEPKSSNGKDRRRMGKVVPTLMICLLDSETVVAADSKSWEGK
ncbi:hypothetical protein Fmac_023289 [Flemingia macrophylla]|uniref:Uncharacterized protein n=1 Tax=Flemingia macrophylla TaxID=520843 RepID=A0ABD1LL79_9FABA